MLSYLSASFLLGIGIAIDVFLATIVKGRLMSKPKLKAIWISGVTFTHIVFPMIGYYGFAYAYRMNPSWQIWLGLVAAITVGWYLFGQFKSWIDVSVALNEGSQVTFAAIIAVSLDALWAGPAKSAQAIEWSANQVFYSFLIAGAVVAIVALLSAGFSERLYTRLIKDASDREAKNEASREVLALWLEFSVIGYFGILAITRYVFGIDWQWAYVLVGTAFVSAFLFGTFRRKLLINRLKRLKVLQRQRRTTVLE